MQEMKKAGESDREVEEKAVLCLSAQQPVSWRDHSKEGLSRIRFPEVPGPPRSNDQSQEITLIPA